MVALMRYDFIYYLIENFRFEKLIEYDLFSKSYKLGLCKVFNDYDYKDIYKLDNNLTVKQMDFSINAFFNHLNNNDYEYNLKGGVIDFVVDCYKDIRIGLDNPKSNYSKLISKEYLREWNKKGNYR